MKWMSSLIILCCFNLIGQSFPPISGSYQGFYLESGKRLSQAKVFWVFINGSQSQSRMEVFDTDKFSVRNTLITNITDSSFHLSESKEKEHTQLTGGWWCLVDCELQYSKSKGYFEGTFKSKNCRNKTGKIILYKSLEEHEISIDENHVYQHSWFKNFLSNYEAGLDSPWKMEQDLRNFDFKPIYFDFDSSVIKDEYKEYLTKMAQLVKFKHDLRIKVTGHTDSVGEDSYNDQLSKRRAKALLDFFISQGLEPHKVVIDFKGEKKPAAPNTNANNRQLNRRVDFSFI